MRALALVLIFLQALWGYTYNELLLDAQSRIYPKLLMLKEDIVKSHRDMSVVFAIVHAPEDEEVAIAIAKKIENYYDHSLGGVGFEIKTVTFEELNDSLHTDAVYLLKGDEDSVKKAVEYANKMGIPLFVYDFKDLDEGALFALTIEQSTVIYMNRKALHRAGVSFDSALYSIVRFVDAG